MGDGWSIAWRVHDAQFWGVPQRRKRIALVADFGGASAPEILFESKGVSGNTAESEKEREGAAKDAVYGIMQTSRAISFQERAGKPGGGKGILIQDERTGTLSTLNNQRVCAFEPGAASRIGGHVYEDDVAGTIRANAGDNQQAVVYGISSYESNSMKSNNPYSGVYQAETARTLDLNGGSPACNQGGMAIVQGVDLYNGIETGEIAASLTAAGTGNPAGSGPKVIECFENHAQGARYKSLGDTCSTLTARLGTGGNNQPLVVEPYTSSKASYHQNFTNNGIAETLVATDYKDPPTVTYQDIIGTIDACISKGVSNQMASNDMFIANNYIVRRLTPLECERLQGFPSGWTDIGDWVDSKGKKHKDADSPRYKALGNSIALPFWEWMAKRMRRYLCDDPTMASLFDGIGGFPLVFSRCGVEPVWASEIEEFPIAVTKIRFPERK